MNEVIVVSKENLRQTLHAVLKEVLSEKRTSPLPRVFSRNQVAKMLGRSHHTISQLVEKGKLLTTVDGRITEESLRKYLNGNV